MSEAGENPSKDFNSDCGVCRFWSRIDDVVGECYRNAPQPLVLDQRPDARPWAVWPLTSATDVCGEFAVELDE